MRSTVAILVSLLMGATATSGQRTHVGIAVGPSFVGGASSRSITNVAGQPVAGGAEEGWFGAIHVQWDLVPRLAFRAELFGNQLHSSVGTHVFISGQNVEAARTDRALGIVGSFVVSPGETVGLTPRFLVGVGPMWTRLSSATGTADAMGMGVQVGVGVERAFAVGRIWAELRYGQAFDDVRGSAFMPVIVGFAL